MIKYYMKNLKSYLFITFLFLFLGCADTKKKEYKPTASFVDIKTYIVGIHPYQNSKQMYSSYRPILDFLEENIKNTIFILETSQSYAQYDKKLYGSHFDFSLPNPYQTYKALSYGYTVIGRMKNDYNFRGIFVVRKDSNIKNIKQLIGHKISFPAPTALAATMMPLYYLYEHGLDVKKDIVPMYVGSQYSSILNAYSKYTIAGATWPTSWQTWQKDNPIKAKELEVVWQTEPLINPGFIAKKDIDKQLLVDIMNILVQLDDTKEGKKLLLNAGFDGFVYSKNSDFNIVKKFIDKYEKNIGFSQ